MNGSRDVKKIIDEYLLKYESCKETFQYGDSCILNGCMQLHQAAASENYLEFLINYMDNFIREDGTVNHFDSNKFNIDSINACRVLFYIYEITCEEKYLRAIQFLENEIRKLPRDTYGNFLTESKGTKFLYELLPFYMEYETRFNKKANYNDIVMQYRKEGEEKQTEWYLLALIDTMEAMSIEIFEHYKTLEKLFKEEIKKVLPQLKEQEITAVGREENGSAFMLTYAIIKACRLGILSKEKYEKTGLGMLEGTIQKELSNSGKEGCLSEKTILANPECMGIFMMAYAQKLMLQKQ